MAENICPFNHIQGRFPADIRLLATLQSHAHFGNANVRKNSNLRKNPREIPCHARDTWFITAIRMPLYTVLINREQSPARHFMAVSVGGKCKISAITITAHSGIPHCAGLAKHRCCGMVNPGRLRPDVHPLRSERRLHLARKVQ